ncbi:MAG: tRNA pseudouridine(38-40) synthase TruA [Acidobacteria bacterium]|nr:MAG: tRNA pseudouridine(38-40) synthase TruA [Acidobacteriota bacterium]
MDAARRHPPTRRLLRRRRGAGQCRDAAPDRPAQRRPAPRAGALRGLVGVQRPALRTALEVLRSHRPHSVPQVPGAPARRRGALSLDLPPAARQGDPRGAALRAPPPRPASGDGAKPPSTRSGGRGAAARSGPGARAQGAAGGAPQLRRGDVVHGDPLSLVPGLGAADGGPAATPRVAGPQRLDAGRLPPAAGRGRALSLLLPAGLVALPRRFRLAAVAPAQAEQPDGRSARRPARQRTEIRRLAALGAGRIGGAVSQTAAEDPGGQYGDDAPPVVRLTIAYLGTAYSGWQRQPNASTVQQTVEEAVKTFCGRSLRVVGAGRTDAGVHADGQEAHLQGAVPPLPPMAWVHGVNRLLPSDVRILRARSMPCGFDARRDARCKRYRYRWWTGGVMTPHEALVRARLGPDVAVEHLAHLAACFVGEHDFAAFAKTGGAPARTRRTLRRCEIVRVDEQRVDLVVEGRGFLRGMVRAIAGTLEDAARGRIDEARLSALLEGGARASRSQAGPNVPALGLTLERVEYDEDDEGED